MVLAAESSADPRVVLLGETTEVSVRSAVLCAAELYPLAIGLVLDGSGRMAGAPHIEEVDAAEKLVRRLELKSNPSIMVGVVEFADGGQTIQPLTNDEAPVVRAIGKIGAAGPQAVEAGIVEGVQLLDRTAPRGGWSPDHTRALVLMSVGPSNGCEAAKRAARSAKNRGMVLAAVCVGETCNSSCMRQLASRPSTYFEARNIDGILRFLDEARNALVDVRIRELSVDVRLLDSMAYVPGSASPEPYAVAPDSRHVAWRLIPTGKRADVTVTLGIEPLAPGFVSTASELKFRALDSERRLLEARITPAALLVLGPQGGATPATVGRTPTPSSTSTLQPRIAAATASPGETESRRATASPGITPSRTAGSGGYPGPARTQVLYVPALLVRY